MEAGLTPQARGPKGDSLLLSLASDFPALLCPPSLSRGWARRFPMGRRQNSGASGAAGCASRAHGGHNCAFRLGSISSVVAVIRRVFPCVSHTLGPAQGTGTQRSTCCRGGKRTHARAPRPRVPGHGPAPCLADRPRAFQKVRHSVCGPSRLMISSFRSSARGPHCLGYLYPRG